MSVSSGKAAGIDRAMAGVVNRAEPNWRTESPTVKLMAWLLRTSKARQSGISVITRLA